MAQLKKFDAKDDPKAEPPPYEGRILDALVGHREAVDALVRAAESGRFSSALIFSGPSGVGKKMAAMGLAQALICERSQTACGVCGPCRRVAHGQSESVQLIEPQGVSIKVEQSREILRYLSLQKLGRARAVIIDDAHAMNPQAANALLKVLEEPPPDAYFFLITSQASSLLPTIRSRAQSIRFAPLTDAELKQALVRLGQPPLEGLDVREARGSVEEALRLREETEALADVRSAVAQLLSSPLDSFASGAIARLREACGDRPAALFAARALQETARDLARRSLPARGGHRPALGAAIGAGAAAVAAAHPGAGLEEAIALGQLALAAETDILGNVDRGLVFENLWLDWARLLSTSAERGLA